MISKQDQSSNLEKNLDNIFKELGVHKRPPDELLRFYVIQRLERSYKSYEKMLGYSFKTLISRKTLRSKKKIVKGV